MGSSSSKRPGGNRQPLLDLWRGLALVDMAWVHLASYPIGMTALATDLVAQHTRFAAGALVLLSGMTVRTAFGSRLAAGGPAASETIRRMVRRALLLVLVDRLACVAFAVLERVALDGSHTAVPLLDRVLTVALFRSPGATGGLLLLYSVLLVATPLMEALRVRRGTLALVGASLAVFLAAQLAGPIAHWPPWAFPVAHWQLLFVLGYATVPVVLELHERPSVRSAAALAGVTLLVSSVFTMRSAGLLGIDAQMLPAFDFTKVPLKPAEALWYVSSSAFVIGWSGLLYNTSDALRRCTGWIARLGRWSLLVYVSHLLLEPPIVALVTIFDPSPFVRGLTLLLLTAGMSAAALVAERVAIVVRTRAVAAAPYARFAYTLVPPAGITGSALAAACLALAMVTRPWMVATVEEQRLAHRLRIEASRNAEVEEAEWVVAEFDGDIAPAVARIVDATVDIDEGSGDGDFAAPDDSPSLDHVDEFFPDEFPVEFPDEGDVPIAQ